MLLIVFIAKWFFDILIGKLIFVIYLQKINSWSQRKNDE